MARSRLMWFLAGALVAGLFSRPVPAVAQQALVLFGSNSGAAKAIPVDASGYLTVHLR